MTSDVEQNDFAPKEFELTINPEANFFIKINENALIEYVDPEFCNVSGYEAHELIGETFHKLLHPSMPKVFFDMIHDDPIKKDRFIMIIKIITKDRRFFWMLSEYITKTNNFGEIINQYSQSTAVSSYIVQQITPLYSILSKIEKKTGNTVVSRKYIMGYLEEQITTYHEFAENLINSAPIINRQDFFGDNPANIAIFNNRVSHFSQNTFNPFNTQTKPDIPTVLPNKKTLIERIFGTK
jgi:hypothetical protein